MREGLHLWWMRIKQHRVVIIVLAIVLVIVVGLIGGGDGLRWL